MVSAEINYVAVLVAAIASMVVGMLWYGPLFGNKWKTLMGYTEKSMKDMKMTPKVAMSLGFVVSLVTSYVLARFVDYLEATSFIGALQAVFWIWLGFVATVQIGAVLWENKSWNLFLLNTVHSFVSLLIMAWILAIWA